MATRITLQSIADRLGCSAKTVSNAFNRPDQLSPATRERILALAAELGYPGPNPLAAGLRRGRVGAIGFAYANRLSYAFEDPVSVALLAGVSAVAESAGAGLLLVPGSATGRRNAASINAAVMDGLLVFSMADEDPLLEAAIAGASSRRAPVRARPPADRRDHLLAEARPGARRDGRGRPGGGSLRGDPAAP
jgi:DNA-binding LacI/PurR family transcriptional regulator